MLKLLHIDNFFKPGEAEKLALVTQALKFEPTEFGEEIPNFNLVHPDVQDLFSQVLHYPVELDEERSGCFRRPKTFIHFEGFDSPDEWCFAVALEDSTFNTYFHLSGAQTALDGYKFNYRNLFEWDYSCNILLKPNQCVFYRPWMFHSFDRGMIHTYRLKSKKNDI